MAKKYFPCPADSCRAANPNQRKLVEAEIAAIRTVEDKDWPSGAMICQYCHCVYSIGMDSHKTVRGYFDNNDKWIPSWSA